MEIDPLRQVESAIEALRSGGVVVYPTETLYGLGVDATDEAAVRRLVALKGREEGKPISVLVTDEGMLQTVSRAVPPAAQRLMRRFWPGPLTLALPAAASTSPLLTGGGQTIGVRCSSHPVATALVAGLGRPMTTPSANPAGRDPARTVAQARAYFGSSVEEYVDGGTLDGGLASTVVDIGPPLRVLREGVISSASIEATLRGDDSWQ